MQSSAIRGNCKFGALQAIVRAGSYHPTGTGTRKQANDFAESPIVP